jgi:hypothetical protein
LAARRISDPTLRWVARCSTMEQNASGRLAASLRFGVVDGASRRRYASALLIGASRRRYASALLIGASRRRYASARHY